MKGNVALLGAGSAIGRALSRRLARDGCGVLVAGRDLPEMERTASDLAIRFGVRAAALKFDALEFGAHEAFVEACFAAFSEGLDGVVLCHGVMPDQKEAEKDPELARTMIGTNFMSAVSLLERFARRFEEKKAGFLCGVSSVAGDRGRQSNYLYGSTKAALTAYLSGLRNRLHASGVNVLTVKPGFVDTAMTWGLVKPGSPIVASPEKVADDIVRALEERCPVLYTPWFWRWILLAVRALPERLFIRMKL